MTHKHRNKLYLGTALRKGAGQFLQTSMALTMNEQKLVMTYLVRNEEDIIEDGIRYHFSQGVDQFIVMDNLSTDATREIVERLSKDVPIKYIFQPEDDYRQSDWVTAMARKAATDYMATWIINSDADEFWVPASGTLKDTLGKIDESISVIEVQRHNAAVTRWNHVKPFNAKSHPLINTVFETQSISSHGKPLPPKIIHRASEDAVIHQGNHSVAELDGEVLKDYQIIKILHFPYQSLHKYKFKILMGGAAYARNTIYPEGVGATWRKEYLKVLSGELNSIWENVSRTETDVFIGVEDGSLFCESTVRDFLHVEHSKQRELLLERAREELVLGTREAAKVVADKIIKAISLQTEEVRIRSPLYNNMRYSLQGPRKQIALAEKLESDHVSKDLVKKFSSLRDTYSLFPKNASFRNLIGSLINSGNASASIRLAHDCRDRIVILHVTCEKYVDRAIASVNSFLSETEGKYHHIIAKGKPSKKCKAATPMTFEYDGLFLTVPVSDSYEALHKKVFHSLMAINFASTPRMVVKLDDDLHLDNIEILDRTLEGIASTGSQYSGREVGARVHADQWHGWHIGKCSSVDIESRGYTYPLPRAYAAGGYGYVLGSQALDAATNMYLSMKGFFEMKSVGLEDAYIGHAMYAQDIEIDDVSNPPNVRALPGLKVRVS